MQLPEIIASEEVEEGHAFVVAQHESWDFGLERTTMSVDGKVVMELIFDAPEPESLKERVQRRMTEGLARSAKRLEAHYPAPRYDEVFEEGQRWLDGSCPDCTFSMTGVCGKVDPCVVDR